MRLVAAHLVVGLMIAIAPAAKADEVTIVDKKAWTDGNAKGFIVTYRHDGKLRRNAKVSCSYGFRPVYLVENLDRGDGVKLDMDVGSDNGGGLAAAVAPGYMSFAIDVWRQTCQ